MLSTGQISIQWIMQLDSLTLIRLIVFYLVDSAIQRLNKQSQVFKGTLYLKLH